MSRSAIATIAVASGKGGVGKTYVSVCLARALNALGANTLLYDGDLGLANCAVMLGLDDANFDAAALCNAAGLHAVQHADGLHLALRRPGTPGPTGLAPTFHAAQLAAFQCRLPLPLLTVVDTPAGIAVDTMALLNVADRLLIVLNDEACAFLDAYALVKAFCEQRRDVPIDIVTNRVVSNEAGNRLYLRFAHVVDRFLGADMAHLGSFTESRHPHYDPDSVAGRMAQQLRRHMQPDRPFLSRTIRVAHG